MKEVIFGSGSCPKCGESLGTSAYAWENHDCRVQKLLPKYLVRPIDFSVFELDDETQRYRSTNIPRNHKPYDHFTFDILTEGYGFFPVKEEDLGDYREKSQAYYKSLAMQHYNSGHE